jgi:pyrimidine operon attenuation protein/uracil phosphoribosyltransferase
MQLPNPEQLLNDITNKIKMQLQADTAIIGIHRGGVWMMQHVLENINQDVPYGTMDAALYRDDFAQRGLKNSPQPADIPFDVNGKHIILIDDIFYTGRTTRAAMNELFDYGRPASVTLAVLINRGGAQLPIAPQIQGASLLLKPNQTLKLSQDTQGALQLALENSEDNKNA